MIGVKNEIKNICTIVEDKKEVGESMWVAIDNTKTKIRLGVIYAPQESRTRKELLKIMYNNIEEQIQMAREREQKVVLLGDFNCKIGKQISGNRPEVTKGGKLLLKLADVNQLNILNTTDKCEGLWTRTDGNSKSVIDYILVDHQSETAVEEMVIDEDKEFAPMTADSVFSDHNVMLAKFNWLVLEKSSQDSS